MKTIYVLPSLALAVMAISSCSSDSDVQDNNSINQEDVPVSFSSYLGTQTRATRAGQTGDMTTETLKTAGFGVLAYYTGTDKFGTRGENQDTPNFMYNTDVTNANGNWTYSPLRYWPNPTDGNDQYVSFFAYAPYVSVDASTGKVADGSTTGITALSSNSATTSPTLNFTLDDSNPVDLLWANAQENLTKQGINDKVKFEFKHALAKLSGLTVDLMSDQIRGNSDAVDGTKTRVTVKSITIQNTTPGTSGILELATGNWSVPGQDAPTSAAHDVTVPAELLEPASGTTLTTTADGTTNWATAMPAGVTTTPTTLSNSAIYFMPTQYPTLTITVDYVVRTLDPLLAKGYTEVEQRVSNNVTFSDVVRMNKQYTIAMHLGLTSVKFDATVSDWDDATSAGSVDLPLNVQTTATNTER